MKLREIKKSKTLKATHRFLTVILQGFAAANNIPSVSIS